MLVLYLINHPLDKGLLPERIMLGVLADLSRALNRWTGGEAGKTLCNRVARTYGYDCAFCRLVAWALSDRDHCLDELSAHEIVALKKRK